MSFPSMAVIIAAAGNASRFQAGQVQSGDRLTRKKPFALLAGKPVFQHSLEQFALIEAVRQFILIVSPNDFDEVKERYAPVLSRFQVNLAAGGKERYHSVENGLAAIQSGIEFAAVHDAARPCITRSIIEAVRREAVKTGGAIPAARLVGTIKRQKPDTDSDSSPVIEATVSRDGLWEAQTPQIFRLDWYRKAVSAGKGFAPTDDASFFERMNFPVALVESDRTNLKITNAGDLALAEMILAARNQAASF